MASKDLQTAKDNKKNEFYTQYVDIEKELVNYKEQFKDKIVYCNCDDPKWSNFTKFFLNNFKYFELKKLICTHFEKNKPSYKLVVIRDENGDGVIDEQDVLQTPLKQNKSQQIGFWDNPVVAEYSGDFRSDECIELLKESDIVVTNPPFSLFREYVSQLIEYNKNFIIIGNVNAISYKEMFKFIKEGKIWLGASIHSGDREFKVPDDYPLNAASSRIDEHGNKYIRVKGVRWFTNLDYKQRHELLPMLSKQQNERKGIIYYDYENFHAINVDETKNIPYDYDGYIGVPITFLDKWSPEQFEIVALGIVGSINFTNEIKMEILKDGCPTGKYTKNAKGTLYRKFDYSQPVSKKNNKAFRNCETNALYSSIYARIIIKHKLQYDDYGNLKGDKYGN